MIGRYYRIPSASACEFCQMLATRSDYLSMESALAGHTNCRCDADVVVEGPGDPEAYDWSARPRDIPAPRLPDAAAGVEGLRYTKLLAAPPRPRQGRMESVTNNRTRLTLAQGYLAKYEAAIAGGRGTEATRARVAALRHEIAQLRSALKPRNTQNVR